MARSRRRNGKWEFSARLVTPAARFLPIRVANNFHCSAVGTQFVRHNGAVRRMRTRIGLLAQPESMRSIVGATQQEQRFD